MKSKMAKRKEPSPVVFCDTHSYLDLVWPILPFYMMRFVFSTFKVRGYRFIICHSKFNKEF